VVDLVDMKAYEYDGTARENCKEIPISDSSRPRPRSTARS